MRIIRWTRRRGLIFLFLSLSGFSFAGGAAANPTTACDRVAQQVASETGLPVDILRAITRIETGREAGETFDPWPWTVNMEGHGVWFDTEAQAQAHVFRHFTKGARSFDIGCFQINYKWHSHAFSSIEDMFDPLTNARYAARYLRQLYLEHGDWNKAVGAYHSRSRRHAQRYLDRYAEVRDALPDVALQLPDTSNRSGSLHPAFPRTATRPLILRSGG